MTLFYQSSPLISGIIGGIIASVLCLCLSKWVPKICNGKSAERLSSENKNAIFIANSLFFIGIVSSIAMYYVGLFKKDDWRGFAIGTGGGSIAALIFLLLFAVFNKRSPKETFVAFSISQQTPPILLYGIFTLTIGAFFAAVISV